VSRGGRSGSAGQLREIEYEEGEEAEEEEEEEEEEKEEKDSSQEDGKTGQLRLLSTRCRKGTSNSHVYAASRQLNTATPPCNQTPASPFPTNT
jgi:TATA-binding protein-associated factor Taf7